MVRRLGTLLRPYAGRLVLVLGMMFLLTGINVARPWLMGVLIDKVLIGGVWAVLWAVLAGFVAMYIGRNLLFFQSKYTAVKVGENVAFELRKRLFERLQQLSVRYYKQTGAGQISSRVMNDSFVIQSFIQDQLPKLLQSVLMVLCLVAALFWRDGVLALAATIVLPLHIITARFFRDPIKRSSKQAQQQIGEVQGNLIEKFFGVEVVKGFGGEERESERFTSAIDLSRQWQLRSHRFHVWQKVIADVLVGLGTILLIGLGAARVIYGHMQPGEFIAFLGWVMMLYPEVLELMSGFAKLTKSSASLDRVFDLLETRAEEAPVGSRRRRPIQGRVTFENVHFTYSEDIPVLRGVTLDLPAGSFCAIYGPSGSGKSTMVNLLPRFQDATAGSVAIDGVNVSEYDVNHLRRAIGIAFQESFLFNSTVMENLRYARPHATDEQIREAARKTRADDFIQRLPNGYDTLIGGNGVQLSRGESQRLTLSRAILKDPKILILDEATASLDAPTQRRIIPAIREFARGKTTLMITHNEDIIDQADTVVCLAEGRVVYHGPPAGRPYVSTDYDTPLPPVEGDIAEPQTPADETPKAKTDQVGPPPSDAPPPRRSRREKQRGDGRGPERHGMSLLLAAALLGLVAGVSSAQPDAQNQAEPAKADAAQANGAAQAEPQPESQPEAQPESQAEPQAPGDAPRVTARVLPQAGLNDIEVGDILDLVASRATMEMGYEKTDSAVASTLPQPPEDLLSTVTLARRMDEGGGLRVLRMGYRLFRSQPPHVYIVGQTVHDHAEGDADLAGNPDVATIAEQVAAAGETLEKQYAAVKPTDLVARKITLSYIEADRCLGMLKSLGYQVIEHKSSKGVGKHEIIQPTGEVDVTKLPAVVEMPASASVDLVGEGNEGRLRGEFGLTMTPSIASTLPGNTTAAPTLDVMVLYHPAKPEQFSEVLDRIRRVLDVPARQILIEAMVLEISETGLEDLGVEWDLQTPTPADDEFSNFDTLTLGRIPTLDTSESTLDIEASDIFGEFSVQLRALVETGEAEVLSRPSVLTLDNRQASLRVGEEIPVATSASGLRGGDKISFNFKYLPVGILLNVRPRIDAEGQEVSMQIDGIVSATVPGEDLVIRDNDGNELARAPRISTRRVQTYSRIANNTPFIIGGLISKNNTSTTDKTPILGDIPGIGRAFRRERNDTLKREVIIVITPFVLPDQRVVGRNIPKDDDAFDSFDNELFRDAYRIRADDVFDLAFITDNPKLQHLKELADFAVRRDFRLATQYPFNRFVGSGVPGERILVYRQMYEVVKRLGYADKIDFANLIYFEPDDASTSGFGVSFLARHMLGYTRDKGVNPDRYRSGGLFRPERMDFEAYFAGLDGQALAVTYFYNPDRSIGRILDQPVPEVRLVDCPDRDAWETLLWELNQPDDKGNTRRTILLHEPEDLIRLQRAVILKRVVQLNANRQSLTLNNFAIGRQLLMPAIKPDKIFLIDDEVAKYFFYTEQYYAALQKELNEDVRALRAALRSPRIQRYLPEDDPELDEDNVQLPELESMPATP